MVIEDLFYDHMTQEYQMPQFTLQERKKIEEALLEQGTLLFTEKGLKKTTVDELTRSVSIAKGSFYHFYENKEVLFFRCMEAMEEIIEEKELAPLLNNYSDPEGMLRDLLQMSLELPDVYPLMKRASEQETLMQLQKKLPPQLWEDHFLKDLSETNKMFQFWNSKGLDCTLDAATFNGVFRAFLMMSFHRKEIGDLVFPPVMELMIRALAKELVLWFVKKENPHD